MGRIDPSWHCCHVTLASSSKKSGHCYLFDGPEAGIRSGGLQLTFELRPQFGIARELRTEPFPLPLRAPSFVIGGVPNLPLMPEMILQLTSHP